MNTDSQTEEEPEDVSEFNFSDGVSIECLDVGAGSRPHPDATVTLDIGYYDHLDFPGVDITTDRWPVPDESVNRVVCRHVLEHVPREGLTHVWQELYRVLAPSGTARVVVPHAGTYSAIHHPDHRDGGGFTIELAELLDNEDIPHWPSDWEVTGTASLEWPSILRPSLRPSFSLSDPRVAFNVCKIPFVDGHVVVNVRK